MVGLSGCTDIGSIESSEDSDLKSFDDEDTDTNDGDDTGTNEPKFAYVGDTIPEVGISHRNLSMTILSWEESDIAVYGPYVGNEYYTFTAKEGRTFIILIFEFQNNWIKPQNTPYLNKGEIGTDKGYFYPIWSPPQGTFSVEYEPRLSTDDEIKTLIGDSAGYEELLPEETILGQIVFEIPENETPTEASIDWVPYLIKYTESNKDEDTESDEEEDAEPEEEPEEWTPEYGFQYTVTVTDVMDGDTFDCILPNGTEERVRILGIDTPETTASGNNEYEYGDITDLDCLATWGLTAKSFAQLKLDDKEVYIEFDSTSGFKGYYGRWLAYVYFINGTDYNVMLLNKGYARVYTEGTCTKESYYVSLENQAESNRIGLWGCLPEEEPDPPQEEGLVISSVNYDAEGDDRYNLNDEYVVIINNENGSVDMTDYTLWDDSDYWTPYTFPDEFMLNSGEEVTVYTGSGTDTNAELYWGRGSPIWNNDHDTAYLKDDADLLVDSYSW